MTAEAASGVLEVPEAQQRKVFQMYKVKETQVSKSGSDGC
jgi:hypothetical protein